MTVIALTGIPGTGKTSICHILRENGIKCFEALEIIGSDSCMENDEVDLDCLAQLWARSEENDVVIVSHYSHLLGADYVIILERKPEFIEKSLLERGYSSEKIFENMDSLYSDIIYQESLDRLPSTRIFRIMNVEDRKEKTAEDVKKIIVDIFSRHSL